MSSLSLLNESTVGSLTRTTNAITCTPALAVLLIGTIVVMFDILRQNPGSAGYHFIVTIIVTLGVLLLCLLGFTHVGTMIILFPIVIFIAIIVIIILALMIGSPMSVPDSESNDPEPKPHNVKPSKEEQKELKTAYKYVMTGKGFGFGFF